MDTIRRTATVPFAHAECEQNMTPIVIGSVLITIGSILTIVGVCVAYCVYRRARNQDHYTTIDEYVRNQRAKNILKEEDQNEPILL